MEQRAFIYKNQLYFYFTASSMGLIYLQASVLAYPQTVSENRQPPRPARARWEALPGKGVL